MPSQSMSQHMLCQHKLSGISQLKSSWMESTGQVDNNPDLTGLTSPTYYKAASYVPHSPNCFIYCSFFFPILWLTSIPYLGSHVRVCQHHEEVIVGHSIFSPQLVDEMLVRKIFILYRLHGLLVVLKQNELVIKAEQTQITLLPLSRNGG